MTKAILDTNKDGEAESSDQIEDAAIVDSAKVDEVPSEPETTIAAPRRRGMSVLSGLVLGGVIAAGIGFYAARYVVPEGWPFPGVTPEPNPIVLEQIAQAERLTALEASILERGKVLLGIQLNKAEQAALDAAVQKLADTEGQLGEMTTLLAALDTRLSTLEKIPTGAGNEAAEIAAAAYERELASIREMLTGELARIEAAGADARASEVDAEEIAKQAAIRAALANLRSAQDSGLAFDEILDELKMSGVTVPGVLIAAAENGVPTLPSLQAGFPQAARAALDASISAAVEEGSVGRVAGFLQRQLGARSLEPQQGDGPDAVLSRAEAALKTGQIAMALQELSALPDVGQAEMIDWVSQAQMRLDALAATEALNTQVNGE